jgi:hypothetical protein
VASITVVVMAVVGAAALTGAVAADVTGHVAGNVVMQLRL